METTGAIAPVSDDTERAVAVAPWAAGGIVCAAATLVVGGLVFLAGADALGLAMLSLLAIVGLFAGFGVLAGYIRLDTRAQADAIERLVASEVDTGLEITTAEGSALFANPAALRLRGPAPSLEVFLTGVSSASDATYRLIAAARRGEARKEDIFVPARPLAQAPVVGTARRQDQWLRVSVRPVRRPAMVSGERHVCMWSVTDITDERSREATTLSRLSEQIAFFDRMPVGVAALRVDGSLLHMNATLKRLLGHDGERVRQIALADILAPDVATMVKTSLAAGKTPARFDVDLIREDGTAVAVHLVADSSDAEEDNHTLAVLERRALAESDEAANSHERFARMFDAAPFGVATIDAGGKVVNANAAFSRLFPERDDARHSIVRRLAAGASAEQKTQVETAIVRALAGRVNAHPVEVGTGSDSTQAARRLYISPLTAGLDARETAVLYVTDATEQKELEAKFAQSQKMEAIGKLVGGIAHDFNNVLQVIIGLSDLMLQKLRATDQGHREFTDIRSNAHRAAGMVRQLLAFSRKQTLEPETLNVNDALQDFAFDFKKTIGEKIDIKHVPTRHLWPIRADKTQLYQVLLNLAVNARDAMPRGGRLTMRTKNVSARESLKFGGVGMLAGEYVLIEVEDTGSGMSADVMARIFEPFYTTKEVGKGTGLGLSTVYGIVKQSGGFIYPESEIGKGTTFRVFLPRHIPTEEEEAAAEAAAETKKKEPVRDLTGTGRVLLVEDEDGVRNIAVRFLGWQGYEVLEAVTGAEALDVLAEAKGEVDLVVSDVIMPEMDGPTMYKEMLKLHPKLKIVFVSGYPRDAFEKSLDPDTPFHFLPKPFTLPQLAAKVKEVLAE